MVTVTAFPAATAILDRLLHHCHVLIITGEIYRVKGSNQSVKQEKILSILVISPTFQHILSLLKHIDEFYKYDSRRLF